MSDTFHFEKTSLRETAELAQAMWHVGGLSPEDAVDIATRALVEGVDGPALRQLAGVETDVTSWEVEHLFDRAWRDLGLEPVTYEEALRRAPKLVTVGIAKGMIDPYYGARWIWQKIWDKTHDDAVAQFIGMVSDYDDWPEERERYTREIIEAARRYAESAQEEKSDG